jgi:lipoprotein-releasing system ATP-binding protein
MSSTATAKTSAASGTSAPAVVVRDLKKSYPTPTEPLVVLKDVNLELPRGVPLAIVGPSGSGKSTLLNVLGTLDGPTSGSYTLDRVDPFSLNPKELATFRSTKIGFVFQEHHLLPQLTAAENVLVAKLAQGRATAADSARAQDLLKEVGLEGRASHLPAELSGAIARAMMNSPSLILADEPTGNLDSKTATQVADLLFELTAKTNAVLIAVTHSMELAGRFARQARMADGALVIA